jgi:hypothetical protein
MVVGMGMGVGMGRNSSSDNVRRSLMISSTQHGIIPLGTSPKLSLLLLSSHAGQMLCMYVVCGTRVDIDR